MTELGQTKKWIGICCKEHGVNSAADLGHALYFGQEVFI